MEDLDPTLQELIVEMASAGAPQLSSLSIEGARDQFAQFMSTETTVGTIAGTRDYRIEGPDSPVQFRSYQPEGDGPHPVLLWLHGGAWMLGDIDLYDPLCRVLADEFDRVVVSVEYRLAPEHPFPAGLKDCYAALQWVSEQSNTISGNAEQIAVGGDSAGGNLAASLCLLARDTDGPAIEQQVLVYPVTSYPFTPSDDANRGYFLSVSDVEWSWSHYLSDQIDGQNPYAAPLNARDLEELPPATVVTCKFDPIYREGTQYARRLSDAAVPVTHVHYDDVAHGFLALLEDPRVEQAWEAIREIGSELEKSHA